MTLLPAFRFAEPEWAHLLWAVLAFGLALLWFERRAGRELTQLVSLALQARMVERPSRGQKRLRAALLVAAGVFAVLALMRPQWGIEYVASPQSSAQLMVALDVSRSMLAEDVAPNRLERAKAEVRDLLVYLEGDQVGLIGFAGRASVLVPLTPDFGFFRLVLDEVGPHSVTRGGTRLEEPIRKAIEGFRSSGDVTRVILLITDGEDHDSFPLDAAREAAERGVSIIAIGYGSEDGSEIPLTDPDTGARTLLRDGDGRIVRTRLDGETLREIALLTGGVYIPAATGALDLESIYRAHFAGLMRGRVAGEGRAVRGEVFQWPLLASFLCLLASVLAGRRPARSGAAVALAAGAAAAIFWLPSGVSAQPDDLGASEGDDPPAAEAAPRVGDDSSAAAPRDLDEPEGARSLYNNALERADSSDLEPAADLFASARGAADTDGEVRFRATYGLGWIAAARADELLQQDPAAALAKLEDSGARFREAVRLRPENEDARHNLELVLQRAIVLADALREQEEVDLADRLDELVERQRAHVVAVRGTLDRASAAALASGTDAEGSTPPPRREEFRSLSSAQRQILSDGDLLAEAAEGERAAIEALLDEQRTPEQRIRAAQIGLLQNYLHRARERMGHARRELRQRRAERAYRRAGAALTELKRARDQLRDPLELLDAVLRDQAEIAGYTQLLAALGAAIPGRVSDVQAPPVWLSFEYLGETQDGSTTRTGELHERLAAGLAGAGAPDEPGADPQSAAARAQLLAQVREAEPLVGTAFDAFSRAGVELESEQALSAFAAQREGLIALAQAREHFLDLRALIETTYTEQLQLGAVVAPEEGEPIAGRNEYVPALRAGQARNIARAERIDRMLHDDLAALPLPDASGNTPPGVDPGDAEDAEGQRQRLELALGLVVMVESGMDDVLASLGPDSPTETALGADWQEARAANGRAIVGLENLRRLFFSIIEHLREAAAREQELADETETLAALAQPGPSSTVDPEEVLGPLLPRQTELARITGELADALEAQSRTSPGSLVDPAGSPGQPGVAPEAGESQRLRRAAELTLAAQGSMETAVAALSATPPEFDPARGSQDDAITQLTAAVAILSPPQQPDDGTSDPQEGGEGEAQPGQDQPSQQQQQQAGSMDPAQLLQSVRDREAERRRQQTSRAQRGYETVEKDW